MKKIGRVATPAEVRAWDIDVRPDFTGLPAGSGTVAAGEKLWEAKCASCHGSFGESNEVFTPIVGGTTRKDIETGRVANLTGDAYPHRTTMMKVSKLSTLWDYIYRAMPWNEPKSLTPDDVYAVLAYLLNLADVVPADYKLSDKNMAEVQGRLPNRNGKVFFEPMWVVRGKGDVNNPLCMVNCTVENKVASSLPDFARGTHGNIAEQVRPFGPARGTVTVPPAAGAATPAASGAAVVNASPNGVATAAAAPDALAIAKANACTACHGITNRIVGPSFADVAKKYAGAPDAATYLADKIRKGGQGVWGSIPMPEQAQLSAADLKALAQWLASGAK